MIAVELMNLWKGPQDLKPTLKEDVSWSTANMPTSRSSCNPGNRLLQIRAYIFLQPKLKSRTLQVPNLRISSWYIYSYCLLQLSEVEMGIATMQARDKNHHGSVASERQKQSRQQCKREKRTRMATSQVRNRRLHFTLCKICVLLVTNHVLRSHFFILSYAKCVYCP